MSFKLQNTLCPYTFQKIQKESEEHVLPKWLRCEEFEDNQWIIRAEKKPNNDFGGVVEGKLQNSDYAQNLGIIKEDGNKINIVTGEVIENKRFFPSKDGVKIVSKYKGSLSKRDIGILNME